MSRIRSIHPGLWTDEVFVSLSPYARLLFMGIWNECDDMGSFDWSPLKLKMRILPADNLDAPATLAEIEAAGCIMRYEHGGKTYGAVRNFCQYQRPKKPTSVCPQTGEVRNWVNTEARSTRDGSEGVGNELPTGGENDRQMKEEGGRRETATGKPEAVKARRRASPKAEFVLPDWVPAEPWASFVEMRRAMPKVPFTIAAAKGIVEDLGRFRDAGHDLTGILLKSVKGGYRGVFAPDTPPGPARDPDAKPMDATAQAEYLAKISGDPRFANTPQATPPARKGSTGPPRPIGDLIHLAGAH